MSVGMNTKTEQPPNKPAVNDSTSWVHRAPPIVLALIGLMVFVSAAMTWGPKPLVLYVEHWGAIVPVRYNPNYIANTGLLILLTSPVTYQFFHGGFLHLFLNSMFLLAFGTPVALRMIAMRGAVRGSMVFLAFFLVSGVVSGMAFVLLHLTSPFHVIGASGSVSALMAAAIILMETARLRAQGFVSSGQSNRLAPVTSPMVMRFSLSIIGLNLAIAILGEFIVPGGAQIAWEAHIAGYLFGLFAYPVVDRFMR